MKTISYNGRKFEPSKIICVGRNYVEHIRELGNEIADEIVIFIKPNSAISQEIVLEGDELIHFEAEITFLVLGGALSGVGFGLDLTKREVQAGLKAKGLPWERAKAFNHSAVLSEFVGFSCHPIHLRLELYVNGQLRQSGGGDLMLHKPDEILTEVKTFLSLEDGDLLMSGTPKGVGQVKGGDEFLGKIYDGEDLLVEKWWKV